MMGYDKKQAKRGDWRIPVLIAKNFSMTHETTTGK
jgi:uncharacterized membrane protein YsdA (DUF1294 family)